MAEERIVLPDLEALSRHAAELIVTTLEQKKGASAVALSGGSTPKRLYELLTLPPYRQRIPWERVHWFWGDERFVPPDHPDSNYLMARLALFARVPVPRQNLHPVQTLKTTPDASAEAYERELKSYYEADELDPERPLLDVNLLGMGDDGHTASLFPGVAALDEQARWTAAIVGAKPEPRISLTLPALNSAREVIFLVSGAKKHQALEEIRAGSELPAARIRPVGRLHWLLDEAASRGS